VGRRKFRLMDEETLSVKTWLSLSLLFFVFVSSCSNANEQSNVGAPDSKLKETVANNSEVDLHNTPTPTVESKSPPNPKDVVRFDGKNYIKKSGWRAPSRDNTYVDESYDQGDPIYLTESGKRVRTNTILYGYRSPWSHSQDFHYDRGDLDYLNGKLEALSFMEKSANGKIFLYSIHVGPVILNEHDHRDPFGYRILDRDGDGIFETLLVEETDIVVPNWVLK
jgi:hypothetical protein